MSVLSMSQAASEPRRRQTPSGETGTERGLRLVAQYIPSEALAAYLAINGILIPAVGTSDRQVLVVKLIAFAAGLLLAIGLVFLGFKPGTNDDAGAARRKRLLLIVFAVVAFLAYAIATPGGPFTGVWLGIAVSVWGAAVAIVLAALLPVLADRLGLRS